MKALFCQFVDRGFAGFVRNNSRDIGCTGVPSSIVAPRVGSSTAEAGKCFVCPTRLFIGVTGGTGGGPGLGASLTTVFSTVRDSTGKCPSRRSVGKLFTSFSAADGHLNGAIRRGGEHLTTIVGNIRDLSFNGFRSGRVSLFKSTCRFLVSGCTTGTNGSNKRFFAPRGMSGLVTQLTVSKLTSIGGVCSPTYNSNSLLLRTGGRFSTRLVRSNFFKRRVGRAACGLTQVGVFLRGVGCSGFSVTLNGALLGPRCNSRGPFSTVISGPPCSIG